LSSLSKLKSHNLEDLQKQLEESNEKTSFSKDETFWRPTLDKKTGTSVSIIRFLPISPQDIDIAGALPYVKYYRFAFKGPTGLWYIERSLRNLNKNDPVTEYNNKMYNSGVEADKKKAKSRKLTCTANIEVIQDVNNPDAEGKVFKFNFGTKILGFIEAAINGEYLLDNDGKVIEVIREPFNPFDFWSGANFMLKVKLVKSGEDNFPNYDDSKFLKNTAHHGGDEEILDKIWNKQYPLQELMGLEHYKPYDELKTRLNQVLGLEGESPAEQVIKTAEKITLDDSPKKTKSISETKSTKEDEVDVPWKTTKEDDDEDYEKILNAFKNKFGDED
jgi:hypothetical protein